ncbi:MAG: excinuclease ABC subunit UvrC [Ruminococcus sp.]|nr:excinuclease ABC subunit UvrC [Ruminococcus sp.]
MSNKNKKSGHKRIGEFSVPVVGKIENEVAVSSDEKGVNTVSPDTEDLLQVGRQIEHGAEVPLEIADKRSRTDIFYNRPGPLLREKILSLPDEPGVYMYLNRDGKVIYVGKAKRLKRRVSSYFNRRHDSNKTNLLVRSIADMRFVEVSTEEDALHLEDAMIKEYQPHYNVLLKDDKSYPWIVITNEPYPRVFLTRDKGEVKGRYYGPYANVSSAKAVLDLIREVFPIRSCRHFIDNDFINRGKIRLCLDYHIKKCGGCCLGMVSTDEYSSYISQIRKILNGETTSLLRYLRDEMALLSAKWKFEEAQELKRRYELVEKYQAKCTIVPPDEHEYDIFAYDENDKAAYINYMHIRHGAVVKSLTLEYRKRMDETKEQLLSMAIGEIERRFECKFGEVIVPFEPDMQFEGVSFIVPQRGDKKKLLGVGQKNVTRFKLDKEKEADKRDPEQAVTRLMQRMKSDFRLTEEPRHIECFDNSNIQGTNPVASCVVFRNGKPSKRDYRHFTIKTVVGADDFASMKEVLHRRYTRLMAEGEELPQLVVVDGGKGQLNAAVEAFDEMGIRGKVALIGIAKRLEEIYFPGDQIPLYIDKKSESLRVVQHLRDEAHRFGITFHRDRRSKGQVASVLDTIKGIGPNTISLLIKQFKSVKRMKQTPEDEIAKVVGPAKARLIKEAIGSETPDNQQDSVGYAKQL